MGEMQDKSDAQLLREYAAEGLEAAFSEIVTRYTDLVYSAALRQVESCDLAVDIAQGVFLDLARKAGSVSERLAAQASLAGWLHRSTRYAALNYLRDRRRRLTHETKAMEQLLNDAAPSVDWQQIRPALDEALDSLGDEDREALLLRFFKNQDFRAVGLALGVSDDAAQKRVSRAVERLREFYSKRNVAIGASGLAVLISANAVQSAPAGLAAAISSAAALVGTTVSTSTAVAATKAIAMTTVQKIVIGAALTAAVGSGIYGARQSAQLREQNQTLAQQQAPLAEQVRQLQRERDEARDQLASLQEEAKQWTNNTTELLRLRGMAGVARRAIAEADQLRAQLARQTSEASNNPVAGAMADAMKLAMEQQVEGQLARMKASLRLTPEQHEAAREILQRRAEAMSAGMQQAFSGKFDKQELTTLSRKAGNTDEQIKALLTPDQQALFPEYRKQEAAYNASLAANNELMQMQSSLDLTPEQLDRAYAALYDVNFRQMIGTSTPPPGSITEKAEAFQWAQDQKTKALESVLTPTQLEKYRQQMDLQSKLIKDLVNKMDGSGGVENK